MQTAWSNKSRYESLSNLYINTFLFIEKHPNDSSKTPEKLFEDMNTIFSYLIDNFCRPAKYEDYTSRIDGFFTKLIPMCIETLKEIDVSKFSEKGIERVQELLALFSNSHLFTSCIESYSAIEKQITSRGIKVDKTINESFIRSLINIKRFHEGTDDKEIKELFARCENYFMEYAVKSLQEGNIDSLWEDNTLNVVLQLKSINDIGTHEISQEKRAELDKAVHTFIENHISQKMVDDALKKIERISKDSKNQILSDPQTQKELIDAYKTVFIYELLAGKQREPDASSSETTLFIIDQLDSIEAANSEENQININTLILRTAQELLIKENAKQIADWPINEKDDLVVVGNSFDGKHNFKLASADMGIRTIEICQEEFVDRAKDIASPISSLLLGASFHELDHFVKESASLKIGFNDFSGYKVGKGFLLMALNQSVQSDNYDNLYLEISAQLAGRAAQIRALRQIYNGENIPQENEKITQLVDQQKETLKNTINPVYSNKNTKTKRWEDTSEVKLIDQIVLEFHDQIAKDHPIQWESLKFEYHNDGTAKSLKEIINDQEEELKTCGKRLSTGPKSDVERAKARFQIMMERAIDTGKEEECVKLINEFVMQHTELFKDENVFKSFNPKMFDEELDARITENLKNGTEEGLQNALFLQVLDKVLEPVKAKHEFAEGMFPCLFRESLKNNNQVRYEAPPQNTNSGHQDDNHDPEPQ